MKNSLKAILVNLSLAIIPFLFIAGMEIYLRHAGYGFENTLFVPAEVQEGQTWYFLNQGLKKKYQFVDGFDIFHPVFPARMKYQKGKNDFRIFCMGESTTQGFPYLINGSFPSFLEGMLQLAQAERNVEVVNLGVTAMNSYGIMDFMRMAPQYQPDLIILSVGHNEFFGALGSASNLFWGDNRYVVQAFLKLQEFKLYLLGRDIFSRVKSFYHAPQPVTSTLMKEIVRIKSIAVGSPLREKTYGNFQANLYDIISVAKENHIPVIVATVVSNLKDFKPFDFERDGMEDNAQRYFDMGRLFLERGEKEKAFESFTKARDKDIIPFRAPSEINEIIREAAQQRDIPLVDLETIMNRHAEYGVLGKPEIIEHLHPSFLGNYQIAAHFTRAIFENGFLRQENNLDWQDPNVMEQVKEYTGFTDLDISIGNSRIEYLMKEWPFNINNADYQLPEIEMDLAGIEPPPIYRGRVSIDSLARMHRESGRAYFQKKDYLRAYRELNAASRLDSFDKQIETEKAIALFYLYRSGWSR
jgi:lysophospholipase L1-like esterase